MNRVKLVTNYKIPDGDGHYFAGETQIVGDYASKAKKIILVSETGEPLQAEAVFYEDHIRIVVLPYKGEMK